MRQRRCPAVTKTASILTALALIVVAVGYGGTRLGAWAAQAADELTVGLTPDPTSVDPRVVWTLSMWGPTQMIFEPLLFRDAQMRLVPVLAEGWKQLDPTHLRFSLRKNVKFQNGEPFDAESVKYTLESVMDNNLKFTQKAYQTFLAPLDRVEINDPYTVTLVTKYPSRSFLSNLTIFDMVPPKQAKADEDRFGISHPAGTGPYKFVEYVPGSRLVLERNDAYWGAKAKTRRLVIRFIPDDAARVAALESGEVAVINNVPPDVVRRIETNPKLAILSVPTTRIVYLEMTVTRAPFNDPRVRKALNYAVDRQGLAGELMDGLAERARSVFNRAIPGYNSSLPQYPLDPAKSKSLIREAGYPNGVKISFGYPTGRYLNDKAVGEAVTAQLRDAGFAVQAETGEWGTYFSNTRAGKYDVDMLALGTPTLDPGYAMIYFGKGAPSGYNDPEVLALLKQGDETFDVRQANAAYAQAQALVWDHGPWVALYFQPEIDAGLKAVQGYQPRTDEYLLFQNAVLLK